MIDEKPWAYKVECLEKYVNSFFDGSAQTVMLQESLVSVRECE